MGIITNREMYKPTISVIVPVYNVESYLPKCVDSILEQSFENIEVLLIDDGSKDSGSQICDEAILLDSRVVVIHKTNGGLSDARNIGISASTCDYFTLVDSDDYIHFEMLRRLYNALVLNDADLVICNHMKVDEKGNEVTCESPIEDGVYSGLEMIYKLNEPRNSYYVIACAKLYKKELFSTVRFPLGKTHEDEYVVHEVFYQCKRIQTLKEKLYFYLQRNDSITHVPFSIKKIDAVEALFFRVKFFEDHHLSQMAESTSKRMLSVFYMVRIPMMNSIIKNNKLRMDEIHRMLKNVYFRHIKKASFVIKMKYLFPDMYLFLVRIKHFANNTKNH